MGHNLGMKHDFVMRGENRNDGKTFGPGVYFDSPKMCQLVAKIEKPSGKLKSCNKCKNFMGSGSNTEIESSTNCGEPTGNPKDCCTGFMDYGSSKPNRWSECSVRDFEQYYNIRQWNKCMNKGKESNLILKDKHIYIYIFHSSK